MRVLLRYVDNLLIFSINFLIKGTFLRLLTCTDTAEGNMKHRQVLHFGKEFVYGSNTISANEYIEPLPEYWCSLLENSSHKGS